MPNEIHFNPGEFTERKTGALNPTQVIDQLFIAIIMNNNEAGYFTSGVCVKVMKPPRPGRVYMHVRFLSVSLWLSA